MATRNGSATWRGDLHNGSGELTVGEHLCTAGYSFRSRFEGLYTGSDARDDLTNPEAVLASAHAACFSMAFALALGDAGYPPRTIATVARVHLRNVDGWATIQEVDLETEADVPGIDAADFQKRAADAKNNCILSRALAGVEAINLSARLRLPAH